MNAPARKPPQPTGRVKPNATAEDKSRAERRWELFVRAFEGLLGLHCCIPGENYETDGDREHECAERIAHAALTLALAAAAKWEAHERIRTRENPAAAPGPKA